MSPSSQPQHSQLNPHHCLALQHKQLAEIQSCERHGMDAGGVSEKGKTMIAEASACGELEASGAGASDAEGQGSDKEPCQEIDLNTGCKHATEMENESLFGRDQLAVVNTEADTSINSPDEIKGNCYACMYSSRHDVLILRELNYIILCHVIRAFIKNRPQSFKIHPNFSNF